MKDTLAKIPGADALAQASAAIAQANEHGRAALREALEAARDRVVDTITALTVEGVDPIPALIDAQRLERDLGMWLQTLAPPAAASALPPLTGSSPEA